jgi:hypothetical protein
MVKVNITSILTPTCGCLTVNSGVAGRGRTPFLYRLAGQSVKHLLQPFALPAQTLLGFFHGGHRTQEFHGAGR